MASVDCIWINSNDMAKGNQMTATVKLKPSGEAYVTVPLPPRFYDCIMKLAQTAADQQEQQMRAEILGDESNEPKQR